MNFKASKTDAAIKSLGKAEVKLERFEEKPKLPLARFLGLL